MALRIAVQVGHTTIDDVLLQRRTDISLYAAGIALSIAARGSHTEIVTALKACIETRS